MQPVANSYYHTLNYHVFRGDFMGGSVHYDKTGNRWFISIYWEKKRYKFYRNPETFDSFDSKKLAAKWLGVLQGEVTRGEFNPRAWQPDSPLSVKEYVKEWLGLLSFSVGDQQGQIKPNTIKDYRNSCQNHIVPFFGNKDIRRIRHSDLVKFQAKIPRSPKGKYNVLSCLRTMLRYAWKNEDIPRVPPFPKLSYSLPEIQYLEFEDQNKIIENIPKQYRPIFYFMQEYGVRPGEARALMWDCIGDGVIIIKRAFAENELMNTTKTGEGRTFEITPFMKDILNEMPRTLSQFVFVREDGKPFEKRQPAKIFHAAREKAGLPYIKLNNAFRHSLGCQLLDQGEDMDLVREQLGHSKIEMTRRYAKRKPARLTNALNKRRGVVVEMPMRKKN